VSAAEFTERVSRNVRIKALLLDQSVFRGVGNIYGRRKLVAREDHPARVAQR